MIFASVKRVVSYKSDGFGGAPSFFNDGGIFDFFAAVFDFSLFIFP